jgi:hypothetical protein
MSANSSSLPDGWEEKTDPQVSMFLIKINALENERHLRYQNIYSNQREIVIIAIRDESIIWITIPERQHGLDLHQCHLPILLDPEVPRPSHCHLLVHLHHQEVPRPNHYHLFVYLHLQEVPKPSSRGIFREENHPMMMNR